MSTDENAAKELPAVIQKLIEGEGYTLDQNLQFRLNMYIISANILILFTSPFNSVRVCFLYFGPLLLGL